MRRRGSYYPATLLYTPESNINASSRTRKVRCDGAKPECHNCVKRTDPIAGRCSYDAAPRRRGKDRTPGSRRLAPLEPKKTRTTRSRVEEEEKRKKALTAHAARAASRERCPPATRAEMSSIVHDSPNSSSIQATPTIILQTQLQPDHTGPTHRASATSYPPAAPSLPELHPGGRDTIKQQLVTEPTYIRFNLNPIELRDPLLVFAPPEAFALARRVEEEDLDDSQTTVTVWTPPGVQFTRETWWDALLNYYSDTPTRRVMTADVRDATTQIIFADLRFLFQNSLHWFAFVNIPRFFAGLWDPYHRQTVQPSLVCSALALSTFFQSSDLEKGPKGREKALQLIDQAHSMFDASLSSGWIDVGLVQAAWVRR